MNEQDDARANDDATGTEGRLRDSMAGFAAAVEPRGDAWKLISDRLDDPASGNLRSPVMERSYVRPVSIAAAILVVLLVAASTVALTRADRGVDVVTQPAAPPSPESIVALTADGRIVELGLDGRERRTISNIGRAEEGASIRVGTDGVIYFTRPSVRTWMPQCVSSGTETEIAAVPFAGGKPFTVVPVAGSFDLSPDGRYLAYAGPVGDDPCFVDLQDASRISVLDLQTGRGSPLTQRATRTQGKAGRVRWGSGGRHLLVTPLPNTFGVPGITHVSFDDKGPVADEGRTDLLLGSQDPGKRDPYPPGAGPDVDIPVGTPRPVDLTPIRGRSTHEDLLAVEKVKGGPLLVTRASLVDLPQGVAGAIRWLPTHLVAQVGGEVASPGPEGLGLAVDRSGRRVIVVTAHGPGPLGANGSDRRFAAYFVEGGGVRPFASGILAATWADFPPTAPMDTSPPGSSPTSTPTADKPSACPPEIAAQMARFEVPAFAADLPEPVRNRYLAILNGARRCDLHGSKYRSTLYPEVQTMLSVPPAVTSEGRYSWGKVIDPSSTPTRASDMPSGLGLVVSDGGGWEMWRLPCDATGTATPDPPAHPENGPEVRVEWACPMRG